MADSLDPKQIVASETDDTTCIAESLDNFERRIWPIYESRGYDKNTALLSYSIGMLSEVVTDILDVEFDD